MSDYRISSLITTLVLMVCGRIAACAADYHVDGAYGSDTNDGLSLTSAFQTLGKGFSSAYAANLAAGTNEQGHCIGSSLVQLVPGSGAQTLTGDRNVEGDLVLAGGPGASDIALTGVGSFHVASRYYLHSSSPPNGALLLRGADWQKTSGGTLGIAYNSGYVGDQSGLLETEGGSVIWHTGGTGYVGAYAGNNNYAAIVDGRLVFGAGTAPVSMIFNDLNVGWRYQSNNRTEGLLDGRAVTGGDLVVSNLLRVGVSGQPAVGGVLLGTNWMLKVGSGAGNMEIGQGGNSCVSTGVVSFAKGGEFCAEVAGFAVGYGNGNSSGIAQGQLLGGEGTEVAISTSTFRVGAASPNGYGQGRVDFSDSDGGSLSAAAGFVVGYRNSLGEVRLGENWDVRIGSAAAPINQMIIGYGDGKCATGIVSMASGSFAAFATNLWMTYGKSPSASSSILTGASDFMLRAQTAYIGYDQDGRQVRAEIDASASGNASVDFGTLRLGYNSNSPHQYGRLALGRGAGIAGTIYMGVPADPIESSRAARLELNGFELAVTNRLEIRRSGQVQVAVDGKSAGPAIAGVASLVFTDARTSAAGPGISIVFNALPEGVRRASVSNHDAIFWGFKWEGDRVADIGALIAGGKIAYDTSGLDALTAAATGVFHDPATGATYIGLYTRTLHDPSLIIVR